MKVVLTYNNYGFYCKLSLNDLEDLSKEDMVKKYKDRTLTLEGFASSQKPTEVRVYNN